jgi:hypothetical protein
VAAADGEISPREKTEAIRAAYHLFEQVQQFCAAAERGKL